MRNIFIGVDGGGTKTKVTVEDESGVTLGEAIAGPANVRLAERAWESVNEGISRALLSAGLSLFDPNCHFHVGLGLAGMEIQEARAAFSQASHPFHTLVLETDAYAACLGVHGEKDGAIIIIGTGVVGLQIEGGVRKQVGGYGFPHSDEGGGAWLGMEALRLALKALDGRQPSTPMLEAILTHFEARNDDALKLLNFVNHAGAADFGSMAPFVLEFLKKGDPNAQALISKAAEEVNLLAAALEKKRAVTKESNPLPLCLLGGVAPFLKSFLSPEIQARLVDRRYSAEKGAIFMVKKYLAEGEKSC